MVTIPKFLLLVLLFASPLCAQVLTVPNGGTGKGTLPAHGPVIGEGTAPVATSAPGSSGQCFLSNGASADPSFQACPSTGGSVSSFSAGSLPPLFTTAVVTATTTPALSFSLSNAAANTIFGNFTGVAAAPSFNVMSACGDATHALSWVMGTGFSCQTLSGGGGGITSINGNTTAAQVITGTAPITVSSASGTTTVACPTCGASGGTALSQITAATATNTIANGNFLQTWNWVLTGGANGMIFGETSAGAGTGALVQINGLSNAVTPLDMEGSGNISQIHIGTAPSKGGWLVSQANLPDTLRIAGGATYSSGWTARATSASFLSLNDGGLGGFAFYGNLSLTAGTGFTPQALETIAPGPSGATLRTFYAGGNPFGFLSQSANGVMQLGAGSTWDGTNYTARTATPTIFIQNTGYSYFYSDSGKTVNSTYSPTIVASINPAGLLVANGGLNTPGNTTTGSLNVNGAAAITGNATAANFTAIGAAPNGGIFGQTYVRGGGTNQMTAAAIAAQGSYLGWNSITGGGELDLVDNIGAGTGGFSFSTTPAAGTPFTQVALLQPLTAGPGAFSTGVLHATTNLGSGYTYASPLGAPGPYLGWNATGGQGESDFVNNPDGAPGGFWFYNTNSSGTSPVTLASLTSTGVWGPGSINTGGAITGASLNITGNSQTNGTDQSTHLSVTGGVYVNGGGLKHQRFTSCSIAPASPASTCTGTFTWGIAFPDINYTVVCSPLFQAGPGQYAIALGSQAAGTVSYTVYTPGNPSYSGVINIHCIAMHD